MTGDMLWIGKQRGAALQNDKYTAVFWVGVGLIKVGLALAFAQIGFDSFDSGSVGILRIQFTVLYEVPYTSSGHYSSCQSESEKAQ